MSAPSASAAPSAPNQAPAPTHNASPEMITALINAMRSDPARAATLFQSLPHLTALAKQGKLTEPQLSQLRMLVGFVQHQSGRVQAQGAAAAAIGVSAPQQAAGQPQVPAAAAPAPALAPAPILPAAAAAVRPPALAGMKRKSPEPDAASVTLSGSGVSPTTLSGAATPANGNATASAGATASGSGAPSATGPPGGNPAAVGTVPFLSGDTMKTVDPGPLPWPSTIPQRPTLSGGLIHGVMSGTPSFVQRPPGDYDLLVTEPKHGGGTRRNSGGGDGGMRTIQDLVASIDPNVKVTRDVEDLLLDLADEFIDSAANFACRIAKHRGSDALDVRDLQLHLERNHNIRIPGFSDTHNLGALAHPPPPKLDTGGASESKAAGGSSKKAAAAAAMSKRAARVAAVANEKKAQKLL